MENVQLNVKATLDQAVVELVTAAWQAENKGVMLARLGQMLGRKGIDFRAVIGTLKLSEYIERALAGQVVTKRHPENPTQTVVVPAEAALLVTDIASLFPQPSAATPLPLYDRQIWAAFSQPLTPNTRRWVSLEPFIQFIDVPSSEESVPAALPLDADLIVADKTVLNSSERNARIAAAIQSWARDRGVQHDSLLYVPGRKTERLPIKAAAATESLLDKLIGALDEQDRRRVQLPLDIVSKLLRS